MHTANKELSIKKFLDEHPRKCWRSCGIKRPGEYVIPVPPVSSGPYYLIIFGDAIPPPRFKSFDGTT